jgi:putative ABC transport system ATP-binding protein
MTASPNVAAIAGDALIFNYQTQAGPVPVLRGASVEAAPGEVVLVIGPSGSGKTTLLTVLAGMLTPASGSVRIEGHDITSLSKGERARLRLNRLGFVFQSFNLIRAMSASENVELVVRARGASRSVARERARELFERLGIVDKLDRLPVQLSGGEQQRVAIARALAGAPAVVLADEPTSSLDTENGAAVMQLLCELAREHGSAVVITSHDQRIARFADRVVHISDGQVARESP